LWGQVFGENRLNSDRGGKSCKDCKRKLREVYLHFIGAQKKGKGGSKVTQYRGGEEQRLKKRADIHGVLSAGDKTKWGQGIKKEKRKV